jgi:hypothetical protein
MEECDNRNTATNRISPEDIDSKKALLFSLIEEYGHERDRRRAEVLKERFMELHRELTAGR